MAISVCNSVVNEQGKELLEHGSSLFPVAFYGDELSDLEIPWHWHDEIEIFWSNTGTTEIIAGRKKYQIAEGEGIFINSGILHGGWDTGKKGCNYHSIVFHPRLVGGSADSIFWQKYLTPLLGDGALGSIMLRRNVEWQAECLNLLEKTWQDGVKEGPGYEFEVREALSKIICRFALQKPMQGKQISEKLLRDEKRMKKMLQYIQDHYEEEITVEEIAGNASVSVSECLRCFHNTIGKTPIQYVLQYRIQQAAGLLKETEEKISDIGLRCGFQDMSYFARMFRRSRGMTPSEYRRQFLNKE